MIRQRVTSAALREVGHDGAGLEIQFHANDCPAKVKQACTCAGGAVFHYPTVTPAEHAALMGAPSIGRHLVQYILKKHEGVKR